MEVTALCLRLLVTVLMLLVAHVQHGYCAQKGDPRIVPDRLQLFEYESVSFKCEGSGGSTGWRVMRKIKENITTCITDWGLSNATSCTIKDAYATDSGKYWCEAGKGERSNSVNIAVTVGSVILESPVRPVMKGDAVTLNCTTKTPSNLPADFYKDGFLIRSDSTGEMTIHSVSKSDEGLYKCDISGVGESPESWLAVRALHKESHPSSPQSPWFVATVLLVALLMVGLLYRWKHRVVACLSSEMPTPGSAPGEGDQTGASVANPPMMTHAVVTKHRKEKGEDAPVYYALSLEPGVSSASARPIPSARTDPFLTDQDCFYSTIH
ncbi:low affinity immunoglobulin gamma Fc region receptor III-A-like isoform X2 [Centroberyx affinis]|uniref:low affinity immunoglobulin gamma Fc region receptor III-A-like isoform X2 n=1 Tax=Centroberyx affinis TaxID=166261 RepID=UPI003A5C6036